MKTLLVLLALVIGGLNLVGAEGAPKGKSEKPSAKVDAMVQTLTDSQRTALLSLFNTGHVNALNAIPGVGETRIAAIIQARPYASVTDVLKVDGVGEGTFAKMVAHAKAGFPPEKKPAPKKKAPAPAPPQ